jgi:biopolymer transport protein ExbD
VAASVSSEDLDINLTPLLDLVLQLLMFFIITVNFVRVDQFDESISLPLATLAVPLEKTAEDWIFLNLDSEGRLVGTLKTDDLNSPQKLKAYLMFQKDNLEIAARGLGKSGEFKIVIIVRADRRCKYSEVWTVLHSCQMAGFKHWQLRVLKQA